MYRTCILPPLSPASTVTLAKGMGNGFPMAAVITTPGECPVCIYMLI